jgi:ORF6N domain
MICLETFDSAMISERKVARIETAIHLVRGQRVMLDSDLAAIYGVSTRQLNQQLKRNRHRSPEDFAFQLERKEFKILMSQIVISKKGRGGRQKLPWVFTEHGAIMLGRARSPSAPQRTARRSVPTKNERSVFMYGKTLRVIA